MRIRYTRLAASHLRELDHYTTATFGVKQAERLLGRIEAAVEGLGTFPERGRKGRIAGTRELVVPGTSFIVTYQLVADELRVLAVLHGSRRWPSSF
jgi:toxin ParE1/3/4